MGDETKKTEAPLTDMVIDPATGKYGRVTLPLQAKGRSLQAKGRSVVAQSREAPPLQRAQPPPLTASPARALPPEERARGVKDLIAAGESGEALLQSAASESEQDISAKWMELREEKAAQMRAAAQRRDDAMVDRMNSNPGFEKHLDQEAIRTGRPRQRFANEREYLKAAHQYRMMQELSRSMQSMPYGGL